MAKIDDLRQDYLKRICAEVIFNKQKNIPNMADVDNALSRKIASKLVALIGFPIGETAISGQTAGSRLESITAGFLENSFELIQHLRPAKWKFSIHNNISDFEQYHHLAELAGIVKQNESLQTALGDYVISPDIVVARTPLTDNEINKKGIIVDDPNSPRFTPLRARNNDLLLLHASISCKWTLRSDRSQNAWTEGLNLIRNRKGHTPHIAVVTGEPLPSRIASLALGTGDIDCVYHFALPELVQAIQQIGDESALDSLQMMIEGKRIRDIADLPFDLII
jgi:hypothetical protein